MRPLEIMDRDMVSVLDLVYESVVELNDDRQPEMGLGLAESWEVSEQRPGVEFLRSGRACTSTTGAR